MIRGVSCRISAILAVDGAGKNCLSIRKLPYLWQNDVRLSSGYHKLMHKRFGYILLGGWLLSMPYAYPADFDAAFAAYQAGDYRQASREFKRLAQGDHARAQYLLGLLYLQGQGVRQDPAQAINWLQRSAENGYYLAAAELGQIYGSGNGVAMDSDEAAKWIALSTSLAKAEDADQGCE